MSYYFSKKSFASPKLDSVLARDEQLTKNINEIVRRKGISASAPKKKKRKPKSKGKHRKGKKVKSTDKGEITISDDPTQRVSGYSVVNVISAKRGPYKKQQPIGPPGATKAKGSFGKSGAVRTGLMASGSDNIQFRDPAFGTGDGGTRQELRGLRNQVDRIEQRLNGMGNLPANQNPAGPLGVAPAPPQQNAPNLNPGGGGAGNAPPPPQHHGFNNLFLPPPPLPPPPPSPPPNLGPPPPVPPGLLPQPPPPQFQPPPPQFQPSSLQFQPSPLPPQQLTPTPRTREQEKLLARDLGVPVSTIRGISDDEFIRLLERVLQQGGVPVGGGTAGPSPRLSGPAPFVPLGPQQGGAVNIPQATQAALERERQLKARGTPRIRALSQQQPTAQPAPQLGVASPPAPETQPRRPTSLAPQARLEQRAQKQQQAQLEGRQASGDSLELESPQLTPRQQAAEEAFLERQAKIKPVGRVNKKKARAALLAGEGPAPVFAGGGLSPAAVAPTPLPAAPADLSPAVSIPGTPFAEQAAALEQFVKPVQIGEEVGQPAAEVGASPRPVAVSPTSGLPLAVGRFVKPGSGLPVTTPRASPVNKSAQNASRYGSFQPDVSPTLKGAEKRGDKAALSKDFYRTENRKFQISVQLRKQFNIPDNFFMSSKGKPKVFRTGPSGDEILLSGTMLGELRKWGKTNLTEDQQRFLNDKIDEWNVNHKEGLRFKKRDEKAFKEKELKQLKEKKAATPLYNISEGPATTSAPDPAITGQPEAELGASGVLVPSTETVPLPSNVNPEAGGISGAAAGAASAVVGGAASLVGGIAQGAVQGLAAQLPTAGQVGTALGQGAVIGAGALVRGGAGAVSGGYQMITAPSEEPSPEI